jgi:hypothetical protein
MLSPPQEFDMVALLYAGRQIYFVKAGSAQKYFTDLGFHCPVQQATPDFLTSLTNPAERRIQPGFEAKVPRTPAEFQAIWEQSETRRQLLVDIDAYNADFSGSDDRVNELKASRCPQKARLT